VLEQVEAHHRRAGIEHEGTTTMTIQKGSARSLETPMTSTGDLLTVE